MSARFSIVSLVYKDPSNTTDQDKDIRLDHISAICQKSKKAIEVRMHNGFTFEVPPKVGVELSRLWASYAKGEVVDGETHKITI